MDLHKNFSNVGELTECEEPLEVSKYFDNLSRLGLIRFSEGHMSLIDKKLYEPLKNHRSLAPYVNVKINGDYNKREFKESYVFITDYGKKFVSICLGNTKVSMLKLY